MLLEDTVFKSDNVGCNPGRGSSHPGETAMRDDVVAFGDDELVFIAQRIWRGADQSEQPFASRRECVRCAGCTSVTRSVQPPRSRVC